MADSVADTNFAWYRLHAAEQAALIVLLLIAVGLTAAGWLKQAAPATPKIAHMQPAPAKINVNHAGLSELAALPGIGPSKAEKIIAAREHAALSSLDDLKRAADGISQANLARMAPFVDFAP